MYAFVVFLGLALALTVVLQVLDELLPVKAGLAGARALTRTVGVVIAVGLAWALDYSVFTAFGQELRAEWMHPVATGLVLVGGGEFVRGLVSAIAHRAGEPPVEAPAPGRVRAA
ncbi:MAG TPA: hypothetical protein VNU26_04920 [Mycobacteriales bacterium]|nr:hypothetical protein [Mycobacteriales bacterium]